MGLLSRATIGSEIEKKFVFLLSLFFFFSLLFLGLFFLGLVFSSGSPFAFCHFFALKFTRGFFGKEKKGAASILERVLPSILERCCRRFSNESNPITN